MSEKGITREESGQVLTEASSVPFSVLTGALQKAGISDNYAASDAETQAEKIANDLAEFQRSKGAKAETPGEYDFTGAPDLVHPDGLEWAPGKNDPEFVKQIGQIFKDRGLSQADAQPFIDAYKAHEVRKAQAGKASRDQFQAAADAEMQKLGPKAKERMDALHQKLTAEVGSEKADALRKGGNAGAVEAMEELLAKIDGAGRSAPVGSNGGPAKEDLSKLSSRELLRRSYQKKG